MYLDTKYKILFMYLRYVSRYLYLRYSPALSNSLTPSSTFTESIYLVLCATTIINKNNVLWALCNFDSNRAYRLLRKFITLRWATLGLPFALCISLFVTHHLRCVFLFLVYFVFVQCPLCHVVVNKDDVTLFRLANKKSSYRIVSSSSAGYLQTERHSRVQSFQPVIRKSG